METVFVSLVCAIRHCEYTSGESMVPRRAKFLEQLLLPVLLLLLLLLTTTITTTTTTTTTHDHYYS